LRAAPAVTIVFARAPVPGRAKSRLAAKLGAWRAARLHARLTVRAVDTALRAGCGTVELHATPKVRHAFFERLRATHDVVVRAQSGSDLGERMHRALCAALSRHRKILLIGTDCPELTPRDLARAARLLAGGYDIVLYPAEDGGFALLGARRVSPELFRGIAWGGPLVYAETARRLGELGYRWRALRTVWDVDRPQDLSRLRLRHFRPPRSR
jgi:uncharacterized protein